MRNVINPQLMLDEVDVGAIRLDPKSRDDVPQLLRGLQHIYTLPDLRERVFAILREVIPQRTTGEGKADAGTGRPGMEQWRILVLGVVRLGLNADYEWSVGAASTAYVGGSLRYLSDQTGSYDLAYRTANGRQREVPSYEVVDLRGGVDFGRYTIEVYAKNVTDSDGQTSVGTLGTSPNGAIGTGVIRPRAYGVAFGVNF